MEKGRDTAGPVGGGEGGELGGVDGAGAGAQVLLVTTADDVQACSFSSWYPAFAKVGARRRDCIPPPFDSASCAL